MIQYEVIETEGFAAILKRTDEDGKVFWIPMVEGNSDYQAYLKRDEAETI